MSPIIALDLDDTLFCTQDPIFAWLEARGIVVTEAEKARYQLGKTEEETKARLKIWHEHNGHDDLRPLPHAPEACTQFIAAGYRLHIVTARPPEWEDATRAIVNRWFPNMIDDIHLLGNGRKKSEKLHQMGAALLIDDGIHNADAASHIPTIIFGDYLWNRDFTWPHRAANWTEAVPLALKLLSTSAE